MTDPKESLGKVRDRIDSIDDQIFAKHGVSMNRIESRPAHTGKWQYAFFIDVSGHINEAPLQAALDDMGPVATQVRVLGSYPVALP